MPRIASTILTATAVSGTLDILSAFVFGGMAGATPPQILRYVASGPFGDGMKEMEAADAVAGLGVHYALMAIMVTIFVLAATRLRWMTERPVIAGLLYGLAIYLVMYWLVVPARFGVYPKVDAWRLGNALFSHLVCVGIPMALVTARRLGGAR